MNTAVKVKRYSENPFVGQTEITTRKKRVVIGKGDNVLIDQNTGEYKTTNITAFHDVDDEKFIKLFTQNIGLMFDLTGAGNKAFVFLSWAIQNYAVSKDIVSLGIFELEEFIKSNHSFSMSEATLRKGLRELVKGKIIANAKKRGNFYINPNFIFNGDRIRFITEIKRKNQTDLEDFTS